jgi:hypothetical protein
VGSGGLYDEMILGFSWSLSRCWVRLVYCVVAVYDGWFSCGFGRAPVSVSFCLLLYCCVALFPCCYVIRGLPVCFCIGVQDF